MPVIRRSLPTALALGLTALVGFAGNAYAQSIPNPLGDTKTVKDVLINVLRTILGLLAVIGVFMFVWGGYQFLLSGGNAESVKRGKQTLFWAAVGLMVVVGSWVLIQFILKTTTRQSGA